MVETMEDLTFVQMWKNGEIARVDAVLLAAFSPDQGSYLWFMSQGTSTASRTDYASWVCGEGSTADAG